MPNSSEKLAVVFHYNFLLTVQLISIKACAGKYIEGKVQSVELCFLRVAFESIF